MCLYRVVKETRQTFTEKRLQSAEDIVMQHKKNHIYWSATSSVWARKGGKVDLTAEPHSKCACSASKEDVIARHVSRFSQEGAGTQHTGQLDQKTDGGSGEQHMTG